ncbi:MAG: hypothetical protein ACE5I1_20635 [bacterium]
MEQIKTAFGEPVRTFVDSSGVLPAMVWQYEHTDIRKIRFGKDLRVVAIE